MCISIYSVNAAYLAGDLSEKRILLELLSVKHSRKVRENHPPAHSQLVLLPQTTLMLWTFGRLLVPEVAHIPWPTSTMVYILYDYCLCVAYFSWHPCVMIQRLYHYCMCAAHFGPDAFHQYQRAYV